MTTKPYEISLSRRSATLYLHKEFGIVRAFQILGDIKPDPRWPNCFVRLPQYGAFMAARNGRYTKRMAEGWASRIRQFVAYQEGRLGRPLTGGDVYVRPAA
jgi:hypothetical protein